MPGHKSFCISEPSLIKLLRDEGSPVCLIRIPNSWWGRLYLGAGGQGVGQWGMDEANLEEPFWSLWSANNDIIDDFDKNLNQGDHEDDANQFWTFI